MSKNPPTILIVEDNQSHLELLKYNIERAGFKIIHANNGREAWSKIKEYTPDLVLLDWMIPEISGIEVCRMIRSSTELQMTPVIIISAREDEEDRVRGLDSGADDYIVKPFSVSELIARLKAQLRRTRPASVGQKLVYEDIVLDSNEHRVFRNGNLIKLGPIEFRLLATLIEQPGRVWSRNQLMDRVWGRNIFIEDRTIDVHVGRLRKALKSDCNPDPVRTVRGVGYALG